MEVILFILTAVFLIVLPRQESILDTGRGKDEARILKWVSILFILSVFACCNSLNAQSVKDNSLILDFPKIDWHDSGTFDVVLSECKTGSDTVDIYIYCDSVIDLNTIDDRLSIEFKFNWLLEDEWPNKIGITSIDIIKDNNIISNMDLSYVKLEAFSYVIPGTKLIEQPTKCVTLRDVNMDSYLDLTFRWNGRGQESYWMYNPNTQIFDFYEKLNYMQPYYIDCKNNIIYSYRWSDMYDKVLDAFKIEDKIITPFQMKHTSYKEKFNIVEYSDALGAVIYRDTIFRD